MKRGVISISQRAFTHLPSLCAQNPLLSNLLMRITAPQPETLDNQRVSKVQISEEEANALLDFIGKPTSDVDRELLAVLTEFLS